MSFAGGRSPRALAVARRQKRTLNPGRSPRRTTTPSIPEAGGSILTKPYLAAHLTGALFDTALISPLRVAACLLGFREPRDYLVFLGL